MDFALRIHFTGRVSVKDISPMANSPSGVVARTAEKRKPEDGPQMGRPPSVPSQLQQLHRLLSDPSSPESLADRELGPQSLLVKAGWRIWTALLAESEEIEDLLRVSGASCEP